MGRIDNEVPRDSIGGRLRYARVAKGIRLTDFATLAGYKKGSISQIENNAQHPSQTILQRYHAILDPLPCKRNGCEGQDNCERCTLPTSIKPQEIPAKTNLGGDLDRLIDNLHLSPEKILAIKLSIYRFAVQVCSEAIASSKKNLE